MAKFSTTFNDIVEFLIPFNSSSESRQALTTTALHGCNVLDHLDYTGNTRAYVVRLVQTLQTYGECETGQPALITLLLTLKTQVGDDKQKQIDDLIAQLNAQNQSISGSGRPKSQTVQQQRQGVSLRTIRTLIASFAGVILFFVAIFGVLPESTRANFYMSIGLLSPSETPSPTPTVEHTATATVTPSEMPTDTSEPTIISSHTPELPTATQVPVQISIPTNTAMPPTQTPTETPNANLTYPCDGTIVNPDSSATVINVVYLQASETSQRGEALRVGTTVVIQRKTTENNREWYLIFEGTRRIGYIFTRFVRASQACPV